MLEHVTTSVDANGKWDEKDSSLNTAILKGYAPSLSASGEWGSLFPRPSLSFQTRNAWLSIGAEDIDDQLWRLHRIVRTFPRLQKSRWKIRSQLIRKTRDFVVLADNRFAMSTFGEYARGVPSARKAFPK